MAAPGKYVYLSQQAGFQDSFLQLFLIGAIDERIHLGEQVELFAGFL